MRLWAHRNWLLGFACLLGLAPVTALADLKEDVDQAVANGVAYLKRQQVNGAWSYFGRHLGPTSLAALTLLECGVKDNDPLILKAADLVRDLCVKNDKNSNSTYEMSLAIMFLDRLGDPRDEPFIESLAVRLMAGQGTSGGWGYFCPEMDGDEVTRLLKHFKNFNEMKAGPKPGKGQKKPRAPSELSPEIVKMLKKLDVAAKPWAQEGPGDNSNTQFATLALWIAKRHGLPVDRALGRIEARFRRTQDPGTGGWAYTPRDWGGMPGPKMPMMPPIGPKPLKPGLMVAMDAPSPTMTCAGLLGLAVGQGAALEKGGKRDLMKDKAVLAGLIALGRSLVDPDEGPPPMPGGKGPGPFPGGPKGPGPFPGPGGGGGLGMVGGMAGMGPMGGKWYYFFWSMERVAVIYGLETIDKKDWYTWGAKLLLKSQAGDGSWSGEYGGGGVDTSFALLFLRRANLAEDLTAALKGRVKDPALIASLKAGNLDELLKNKGTKPGVGKTSPSEKTTVPEPGGDAEATQMGHDFAKASSAQQEKLLETWRDTKGTKYTEALASTITLLKGDAKTKVREALAQRLTRMTAKTLRGQMEDDDVEIRRAAATAAGVASKKELIPDLIKLLDDPQMPVTQAARRSLKAMTRQDFGPEPEATRAECISAMKAWKSWWKKNGGTP
jgi:hypothetical protein